MASATGASEGLKRIHFEVFGLVQGVFFRKCTLSQAREYNLVGWVRNNRSGTVEGEAEGAALQINAFKDWLSCKGSPQSRIDKCIFSVEEPIDKLTFKSFNIARTK
ncbi:unnamed protein product [Hymenolepis diminuta]|uniref:Acylphosphatase n=1 Tax=Hymenolepis diminuta TaxID=6216 RepID=A0A564Z1A3_HYMDI|nr:unnamed protein product [Hymenolepis diminuta]